MADIVELSHPDNVELVAGAVQNWADLPAPAAAEPLLRSVRSLISSDCSLGASRSLTQIVSSLAI